MGQGSGIITAVDRVSAILQVGFLTWELPHAMIAAKKKGGGGSTCLLYLMIYIEEIPGSKGT